MNDLLECDVCGLEGQAHFEGSNRSRFLVRCVRCGQFEWEQDTPHEGWEGRRVQLSGYICEQNAAGIVPVLTPELVAQVAKMPIPRLPERAMRLLSAITKVIKSPRDLYRFDGEPQWLGVSYCADAIEFVILLNILSDQGFLSGDHGVYRVSSAGYIAGEAHGSTNSASASGFVAMSFKPEMNASYQLGFDPGIRAAGYRPMRIDQKDHVNSISDEILAEIRRARFLVADYTYSNNGVYFEAGFAIGLGVPVIPTCREDGLNDLHFDIRHINTLVWKTPEGLAAMLSKRISAVIGDGPHFDKFR